MAKRLKLALALSGGVDSAAAGIILKSKGYLVTGLYMNLFGDSEGMARAKLVAEHLDIPFYPINIKEEFEKRIIKYFLEEYEKGRTPNPCVKCNKDIKFGIFYQKAIEMGFDKLATGHYVRLKIKNKRLKSNQEPKNLKTYHLYIARDEEKDQSYFLYNLTQEILAKIEFPLGDYKKSQARELAKKKKIPFIEKESQDICFLAFCGGVDKYYGDHNEFLKRHLKLKGGDIITLDGEKIGEHEGLPLYTIGQRRAIGVGGTGPYYVVEKNLKDNILIVTENPDDTMLYKDKLEVEDVNWISGKEPCLPLKSGVRIRYRHKIEEALIEKAEGFETALNKKINKYIITLKNPQRAITPGQSAVFYNKKEMLGGGIIS